MKKASTRVLKIAGIAFGSLLLAVVVAALLVLFHKPLVRNVLQSRLAKATGMTVRIGRLDYRPFPLRVVAESVTVGREDAYEKLDIDVARLEADGRLGGLLRGEQAALERVVIDGIDVRYQEKAASPEPVDYQALLRQAADMLALVRRLEIGNARIAASMPPHALELEDARLELTAPGSGGGSWALHLQSPAARAAGGDGSYSFDGGLRAAGTVDPGPATAVNLRVAILSPRVSAGGSERAVASLLVEADGIWEMEPGRVSVSRLSAGVPGLVEVTGAAAAVIKGQPDYDVFATLRLEDLEAMARLVGDGMPAELRETRIGGRARADVRYISPAAPKEAPEIHVSLKLERVELGRTVSGVPVRASLEGGLEIDRLPVGFGASADLRAGLDPLSFDRARLGPSSLRLQGRATPDRIDVSALTARIDGLSVPVEEGREVRFERVDLSGRGSFDPRRRTLEVPALRAVLAPLPPFALAGRLDLEGRGPREVKLKARGFDIPAIREFLGPFLPEALAEWEAAGRFDLEARAAGAGRFDGAWDLAAGLSFSEAAFNDPSFVIAGEGLAPVLRLSGTYDPGAAAVPFSASLALGRGESLFRSFYVSWDKHPVEATLAGRYELGTGTVEPLEGRVLVPTIGRLDVSGAARVSGGPSFDLRSEARLALAPFYSLYTQAGVAEESRMRPAGDLTARLDVAGREGGSLSVRGRLDLEGASLENPVSKLLLAGVSAAIPIHYDSAAGGPEDAGDDLAEQGFLRIASLRSPFLALEGLEIGLRAGANAYRIEPLKIDLFGGRLETGAVTVRVDPLTGEFRGLGSLALRDLDIARFPIASPQFQLTGTVRAEFSSLDFTAERIAVAGRGEADVFGGQVILRDLAVDRPFSEARTISLNVDLLDLDLKRLTDEVPFGEVTGIVRGEIRDLVLSYGQPERFELRIESVPRKGVPQTFSLKAVDNLTVLSSGEQASAGTSQFWMRFIRGFRYERLGIVSTLRNDTFTLNGTIREGGVEYLVKKPALFGISVVNRMPDKVISFKEMTNRLRRVGQSEK